MSEWFYVKDGKQQGPVSDEGLQTKLDAGELNDSVTVWKEGMTDWLPINERNSVVVEEEEKAPVERAPLEGLAPLQVLSIIACLVCLLNPFAAFAFVYSLQAKNAHEDGREADALQKKGLCKRMLTVAFILSVLMYTGAVWWAMNNGLLG